MRFGSRIYFSILEGNFSVPPPNPIALQLSPLPPYLESELQRRFDVHHWAAAEEPQGWLQTHEGDVRVVVTGANAGISNSLVRRLPALQIIALFGVGADKVDLHLAASRGVRVTNTPDVLTDDVADLALGLVLALLRHIPAGDRRVRAGAWPEANAPLAHKVSGRHFGIVGLGRIGKAIAARLSVLGSVSYTHTRQLSVPYPYFSSPIELARACSVLVLAASANASTQHLIGREVLDALGPYGYIVNVARGSLIDEPELIAALQAGRIAGAALDVFADEPHVPDTLRGLENVVLTPHIGSATEETRAAMARSVLANLDAFFSGAPLPSALV
jgi:lactate dehydrogenase-like 2-hydroxyacid dehydrogenase